MLLQDVGKQPTSDVEMMWHQKHRVILLSTQTCGMVSVQVEVLSGWCLPHVPCHLDKLL